MILFFKIIAKGLVRFLRNKNERRFIYLVILYGNSKRYKEKNININSMRLLVPDALSFIWQFKEIFADENYKFKTDSVKPVIFDCGANIGVSCLYFSKNYPGSKIIAFEADPAIVKILRTNLETNNVNNVEVIDKAVWINDEDISLSIEGADGATVYSNINSIKVKSVRLKNLLENEQKIDLLKMDIEGAEQDVIIDCGNSLKCVRNIFIEYHSINGVEQKLSEILNVLEENKFRYFIKPVNDREKPFLNRSNKNNPMMDLQLNIFGYKET